MNRLGFSLAVSAIALAGPAVAGIINVGPGESIQAAINAASDGDEVVVAPGTYFETIDFLGKAITLRSSDGPEITTIDAQGTGSVVTCDSGEGQGSVLSGFTITGGTGSLQNGNLVGGGMFNSDASPSVTNCVFTGNLASGCGFPGGAGMYNLGSNPTVTNCTFTNNESECHGGGMYNVNSNPNIINCSFVGNQANGGGDGGGMSNHNSNPTVYECSFIGNTAGYGGGGMDNVGSSPTLFNCLFDGNVAGVEGGGMYNSFGVSDPTISGCTFKHNSAGLRGGGIGILGEAHFVVVTDSLFCQNPPGHIFGPYDDNGGNQFSDDCSAFLDCNGNGVLDDIEIQKGLAGDVNGNGIPDDCECLADVNGSGEVNVIDLIRVLVCFGLPASPECVAEDVNFDGVVNVLDLIDLLLQFGQACP